MLDSTCYFAQTLGASTAHPAIHGPPCCMQHMRISYACSVKTAHMQHMRNLCTAGVPFYHPVVGMTHVIRLRRRTVVMVVVATCGCSCSGLAQCANLKNGVQVPLFLYI